VSAEITAIPAIVLGQVARRRVRRSGERGFAAATAAVMLGWLTVLIAVGAALVVAQPARERLTDDRPALPPWHAVERRRCLAAPMSHGSAYAVVDTWHGRFPGAGPC
jgi:Domain of unknown function (DUF4190)